MVKRKNVTDEKTTESPTDGCDVNAKISDITEGPEIVEVTEADKKLPYKKKLELIEQEAKTLYDYALLKGLSSKQIRTCMAPLTGNETPFWKRCLIGSSKSAILLLAITAIAAGLWRNTTSRDIMIIHGKLLLLQTIPLWNWTYIYNEDCLVTNTFLPEKNYTDEDCAGCIEFAQMGGKVRKLRDVNAKDITDNYLYLDFPFIVTDAVKDWPKDESGKLILRLERFNEIFQKNPIVVDNSHSCEFISTIENHKNLSSFVEALAVGKFPDKFNVVWDNCDVKAAKVFRSKSKRPYFIPPMAQASSNNQIVIAKGTIEEEEFTIPQNIDSAAYIIVLQGEITVTLRPIEMCSSFKCKDSTFKVTKGQAVVIPTSVWELLYRPTAKKFTLAIASTMLWDAIS